MSNDQLEKRDYRDFNFFLEYRDFMEFKSHNELAKSFKENIDIRLKMPYVIFNRDYTERKKKKKKATLAICVKDNPNILSFCLTKLKEINADTEFDFIVVDDRSASVDIEKLAEEFNCHYIRVDNEANVFNYSMLNNIAASFSLHLGYKDMICWNSDMWADSLKSITNIFKEHKAKNAAVTGTRLLYPKKEEYQKHFGSYNHVLGDNVEKCFNTIQHGGIQYAMSKGVIDKHTVLPYHKYRFQKEDTEAACKTQIESAVTGALHILNLEMFKAVGGYNPSLVNSFQDIDYCQKATTNGFKVLYVGKEKLYHAESITNNSEGNIGTIYAMSDRILYELLWPNKTGFNPADQDTIAHIDYE